MDSSTGQAWIAVLLTCYNRAEKTLVCLANLLACALPQGVRLEVYLVDDGSVDQTGKRVREAFPDVRVIEGTGNLYWCRGMRLAWETASCHRDYDFYLWLNDDVVLYHEAIRSLLSDFSALGLAAGAIVGSCCDPATKTLTYGGREGVRMVQPTGVPRPCAFMHGNVVLVPGATYRRVGGMSSLFTHGFGDSDYSLRIRNAGLCCYVGSAFAGECPAHAVKTPWLSSQVALTRRLSYLNRPIGANFSEYVRYKRLYAPRLWWFYAAKLFVQILCPAPFEWYWFLRRKLAAQGKAL